MKRGGFPGDSVVKNPPAKQETQVRFLGQEDPLEKEMATHSSILAWGIARTEKPGGLQSLGSQKSQTRLSDLNSNNIVNRVEAIWLINFSCVSVK